MLLACLAMPIDQVSQFSRLDAPDRLFDPVTARAEHLTPGEPRVLSKKEEWAREKTRFSPPVVKS